MTFHSINLTCFESFISHIHKSYVMRAHVFELTLQVSKYAHEYSINHSVMPLAGLLLKMEMMASPKK